MKASWLRFLIPLCLFMGVACENKVDLNAPKKDITSAYGILDGSDSLHFVKVNKAFLPEGNAETYARKNYSSTYYENLSVTVQERNEEGDVVRSFGLEDTMVDKKAGLFEHDEPQKLYYFAANDLDPQYIYSLQLLINEGGKNEKKVHGETNLVGDVSLNNYLPGGPNSLVFYSAGSDEYQAHTIEWSKVDNAASYLITLRIHYKDIFSNGDTIPRTLEWQAGKKRGSETTMDVSGEGFYRRLDNELSPNPSGLLERRMGGIEIRFDVANQELNTYNRVASPSASIVQHRTSYSNLDSAAVGIFASSRAKLFDGFSLSTSSEEELTEGDITGHLKFSQ